MKGSESTLYNWRSRYGELQVSDAKPLLTLGEENRVLKIPLATAHLDFSALQDIASAKFRVLQLRRRALDHARRSHGLSQRRASS
jgi:putative transposase